MIIYYFLQSLKHGQIIKAWLWKVVQSAVANVFQFSSFSLIKAYITWNINWVQYKIDNLKENTLHGIKFGHFHSCTQSFHEHDKGSNRPGIAIWSVLGKHNRQVKKVYYTNFPGDPISLLLCSCTRCLYISTYADTTFIEI